jgi:hypothetical protein
MRKSGDEERKYFRIQRRQHKPELEKKEIIMKILCTASN